MSRITAPASKLARSLNTASTRTSTLEAHRKAGAILMPKYAELLRGRRSSERTDSSRHLYTTHRPTPQPSLANRSKPLMQTFHTSTPSKSSTPIGHLDTAVLPSMHDAISEPALNMPLLPDNYGAFHVLETTELKGSDHTIFASNPDVVVPGAPLASIETFSLDGVELKFMHEQPAEEKDEGSFIGDLWRGMVDDVFGAKKATN